MSKSLVYTTVGVTYECINRSFSLQIYDPWIVRDCDPNLFNGFFKTIYLVPSLQCLGIIKHRDPVSLLLSPVEVTLYGQEFPWSTMSIFFASFFIFLHIECPLSVQHACHESLWPFGGRHLFTGVDNSSPDLYVTYFSKVSMARYVWGWRQIYGLVFFTRYYAL